MDVLNTGAPELSVSDMLGFVSRVPRLPAVQRVLLLCRSWTLRYRLQTETPFTLLSPRYLVITETIREIGTRTFTGILIDLNPVYERISR